MSNLDDQGLTEKQRKMYDHLIKADTTEWPILLQSYLAGELAQRGINTNIHALVLWWVKETY